MKLRTKLSAAFMLLSLLVFSQTAKVQIIHNSPTPTVDIYANGAKLLDNFAFRTATPYVDIPAGVVINVGVALGTSATVKDTIANFPVTFQAGKTYVVVANGIVGNAQRPFKLAVMDMGSEKSDAPSNVGIAFFHGSPDAPAVDIRTGGNVVFGNTSFGNFARTSMPYANVPANATYQLQVTPGGSATPIVASFEGNFSFWQGKTAVIFASGLLGSQDPNDSFGAWVALSNGGTFPLKVVQGVAQPKTNTAQLQIIHNSPTPTVDIYVNGAKLLDNFVFRTATPYIPVPAGVTLSIAVAPATSTSVADAIATYPVKLDSGKTYIAVAYGIVGNAQKPFGIAISDAGRVVSANPNNVDIGFFHGSPDAPDVDILAGNSVIFNDIAYGKFGNYISVPANATYRLGVTPFNNNNTVVARYDANLDFWKGKTAVVIATGFLGAGNATPFVPYVVLSNGGTFPLTALQGLVNENGQANLITSNTQKGDMLISPNPASGEVNIKLNLVKESDATVQVLNVAGQVVRAERFDSLYKGQNQLTLNIQNLKSGYYIIRSETADGVQAQKLMIIE